MDLYTGMPKDINRIFDAASPMRRKAIPEPTGLDVMTLCEAIWDKGYDDALLAAVDAGDECEAGRIVMRAAREYAERLREIGYIK